MADISNVSAPLVRPASSGARSSASAASQKARGGYAQADEVTRRANVLNETETPENTASLNRLDRALSSNQPLRGDVPRGFYLNLRV